MPEVGLAIGRENLIYDQINREWLFWYDQNAVRYLTPWEKADARADTAKANDYAAKNKLLDDRLRELGVDPNSLGSGQV